MNMSNALKSKNTQQMESLIINKNLPLYPLVWPKELMINMLIINRSNNSTMIR